MTHPEHSAIRRVLERTDGWADATSRQLVTEPLAGVSNQSFKVTIVDDEQARPALVVRLPGVDRSHWVDSAREIDNERRVASLGLGAPILYADAHTGERVSVYLEGSRPLTPVDMRSIAYRVGIIAMLRRLHRSGLKFTARLEPLAVLDTLWPSVPMPWRVPIGALRARLRAVRPQLSVDAVTAQACHGDPSPANILTTASNRLVLIDWEYAGRARIDWDLSVIVIESKLDTHQARHWLRQYLGHFDEERWRTFTAHATASATIAAAWAAVRQRDHNDRHAPIGAAYVRERLGQARYWLRQSNGMNIA